MVVCSNEDTYCAYTICFGIFSIICLLLVDCELIMFNTNQHIVVLFIARALCIAMILEYFVNEDSQALYFVKEYVLLIGICTTSYYFTFQAYNLLKEITILRYSIFGSIVISALSLILILFIFIISVALHYDGIPCNDMVWLVMRIVGLLQAVLFVCVGLLVRKKVSKFAFLLNQEELAERFFCLKLFTSIVVISTVLKFFETMMYYIADNGNCFAMLDNPLVYPLVIYSIMVLVSDYSIIFSALFFFFKYKKTPKKTRQITINSTTSNDIIEEVVEIEPRHSSGSIKDYILYSN